MTSGGRVCLLLSEGGSNAIAAPLAVSIGLGSRGEALRRVDVAMASADASISATVGASQAYNLLYREKYLDRRVTVAFDACDVLQNVHGRSADLAFALAFALEACTLGAPNDSKLNFLAVTGELDDDGAVRPVANVCAKLAAAIEVLQPGGKIVCPSGNQSHVPAELISSATARGLSIVFAARLEEALQHAGLVLSETWHGSPFRGLASFEFEHAAIFFGRDQEIDELVALIARKASDRVGVLIEGPSGAGKSSLALAGLLPALVRRGAGSVRGSAIRWGVLKPHGANLDEALCSIWTHGRQGGVASDPAPDMSDSEAHWAWLSAQTQPGAQCVLVLDQLDEWFEPAVEPSVLGDVARLVAALQKRGVWLVGTATRSGRKKVASHPILGPCFGVEGVYSLHGRLDAPRLEGIIQSPAKVARLSFEPGLSAKILQSATSAGEDVLPVLELLLTELFERRDAGKNLLRLQDYDAVGGLDGVVSARAEAAFQQVDSEAQAQANEMIWRLAGIGHLVLSDFSLNDAMRRLLAAFQQRRLLAADEAADGGVRLRAIHDALLRLWPRVIAFRLEYEAELSIWRDLMREAEQWRSGQRALIPEGPQLSAASGLMDRRAGLWTESDQITLDFVRASRAQHSRRTIVQRLALGAPIAIALGAGGVAGFNYLQSLSRSRLDFESIPVPPPDYSVAAAPYLQRYGIYIEAQTPPEAHLLIKSNSGLYQGRAASPYSGQHFLTQQVFPGTAPMAYTLRFADPPRAVYLMRAGLWAESNNGVSHPAWSATAFDETDAVLARASEATSAVYNQGDRIPPQIFALEPEQGRITRLLVEADYRDESGRPYAAFQSVLIKEIVLGR